MLFRSDTEALSGSVFEALACGTPVICNETPALREVFGDTLLYSGSPETTLQYLKQLNSDSPFRWRIAVQGWRLVLQQHRVDQRIRGLVPRIDIPCQVPEEVSVSILTYLPPEVPADMLIRQIRQQRLKPDALILLTETPPDPEKQEQIFVKDADIKVFNIHFYNTNLAKNIMDVTDSTHFAVFSPGCFYGENYLSDYALAARFYNAGAIGKCNYFNFASDCITEIQKIGRASCRERV